MLFDINRAYKQFDEDVRFATPYITRYIGTIFDGGRETDVGAANTIEKVREMCLRHLNDWERKNPKSYKIYAYYSNNTMKVIEEKRVS